MDHNNKFLMRLIFCISFVLVFGVTTQTAVAYQAYTHNALTDKVDGGQVKIKVALIEAPK